MPGYNDTPLATNPINQTQAPIRTNFQSIMALIDVNHVDFADPINFGKHNLIQFVEQPADPATAATELAMYTKDVAGSPQLFLRLQASGDVLNLTSSTQLTVASVTSVIYEMSNGFSQQIGFTVGNKLGVDVGTLVNFPTPFTTICFSVVVTQLLNNNTTGPNNILHIVNYSRTGFTVFNRGGTGGFATDCTFFALGF